MSLEVERNPNMPFFSLFLNGMVTKIRSKIPFIDRFFFRLFEDHSFFVYFSFLGNFVTLLSLAMLNKEDTIFRGKYKQHVEFRDLNEKPSLKEKKTLGFLNEE